MLKEREAKDPIKNYSPGKTQSECESCPAMVRMLQGGNRTGKTAHMLVEISKAARRLHPIRSTNKPVVYVIWAKSREQIRDVLYQKMRVRSELKGPCENEPMIPDYEVVKDHMVSGAGKPVCREIELKNANRILFAISGVDKSWESLQGKGRIAGIGVDEQAGTQKLVDECMARLMELNNPSDVAEFGGAWFMWASSETLISDAWDNLKSICLDPERNQDAKFFHIKAEENKAVTAEARTRVGQFMSERARAIRITGDGDARAATLVYGKQWSDSRHMLPSDHQPSPNANLWVGYDPGVGHETGMVIGCIEPRYPMQIIVTKVWSRPGHTVAEDTKDLANYLKGRKLTGFVYDRNVDNRNNGGGLTALQQMKECMTNAGIEPIGGFWVARKKVADGIATVRHYLDPAPDNRATEPLLVINPSEGSGGKLMRWQFLKYSGHEEKQFTGAGAIIKKDDDALDALRYLIMQRPCWNPAWACGIGSENYNYTVPLPDHAVEKEERPLTQDEQQMQRLMEMSRMSAAFRGRRRGVGNYVSI
jgi:hypothetical protein